MTLSPRLRSSLGPLLGLCLVLSCATGCDKKETESSPAETDKTESKAEDDKPKAGSEAAIADALKPGQAPPAEAAEPPLKLSVVSPGAEPRRQLTYEFKADTEKKFSMNMQISMTMMMNGQAVPSQPPQALEITGTTRIKKVEADGSAIRETTFGGMKPKMANLPPQAVAQFQQQMAAFTGLKMTETVSPQGQSSNMQIDATAMLNPQAQQLLQNLKDGISNALLPLPVDKVGVGAKWEDRRDMNANGVVLTQVGTFELVKMTEKEFTVEISMKQVAKPTVINDPRLPPGAKQELLAMEGTGVGTAKINRATLDVSSDIKMDSKVETKITGAAPGAAPGQATGTAPAPGAPPTSMRSTVTTKVDLTVVLKD